MSCKTSKTKSLRGGYKTRIPAMNDSVITGIQKIVGTTVGAADNFFVELDKKFDQSVKDAESIKIGDQRLIHAGGKKKTTRSRSKSPTKSRSRSKSVSKKSTRSRSKSKSKTTKKKSTKRSSSKKTIKRRKSVKRVRKHSGGGGSDFALTLNSRGPVNAPDNGWYNGKQLFQSFSKTGEYIPNSQLPYAAAPISTLSDVNKNNIVVGFDNFGQQWSPV